MAGTTVKGKRVIFVSLVLPLVERLALFVFRQRKTPPAEITNGVRCLRKLNKHKKNTCHCQVIYPVLVDLRGMPVRACGLSHLARVVMLNANTHLSVVGLKSYH